MVQRFWQRPQVAAAALLWLATGAAPAAQALTVGDKPTPIELSGEAGGKVDGTPWSSSSITGKLTIVFYVAPGHRNDNEDMKDALKEANFPLDKVGSVAIANMAASWLPNSVLNASLRSNQEKFPHVTYVKDMDKAVVKAWHIADDAFDVVVFDRNGVVLFTKDGDFTEQQTKDLIALVRKTWLTPSNLPTGD